MTCCVGIRAIALFEALGGFDRQYLGEQATSDTRSKEAVAKYRQTKGASVGPGGTGYGTGSTHHYDGYGYGGGYDDSDDGDGIDIDLNGHRRTRGPKWARGRAASGYASNATALAVHWDVILVRALTTITSLLPSPYSEDAQVYDMLPHPSIAYLLSTSQLPELLASLLRNDSITDWTARSDLYNAMLVLLRRVADCELTLQVSGTAFGFTRKVSIRATRFRCLLTRGTSLQAAAASKSGCGKTETLAGPHRGMGHL